MLAPGSDLYLVLLWETSLVVTRNLELMEFAR